MSHIKKEKARETPAVSTASLPDIVFMLLFFFMVATTMREVELKVTVGKPSATEIQKLERKDLVCYVYVGAPKTDYQAKFGTEPRVQLDDQIAAVSEVGFFVTQVRSDIAEAEQSKMTVSIKADGNVKMGLISDIKQELRQVNALLINYSTQPVVDAEKMFESNM
ncbi:MAG: biopolymer transporter ExbD [Bacteroidetes bacterium]|uniref:Biopolymer transporter ExbD n=1 Tax=Phaeocystidibacter marisrubri TaxID=1577780 RepID=A0A6L3ZC32_9FLAO|nr:biopolymer transporter ExbD [Phaeocystidibacter marisrubri]KAB2815224.1 biopolymer transporter ExbD [Phaeocystidibacter marisrubri]TNE27251.1 MAG: biopolymer transporter ExbD [Bacteroidota bacterium]GGH70968.1 biopolymer transporter ExbD [Phaeocystidibacter marisrubri]